MEHIVLCPGSRSSPLALSVAAIADKSAIKFYTAIDERSAAFMALGIAAATGNASAVITTSGTAVANLLPAAVEADRSCLPIIFITADRPLRLKNCGANQTVNQEDFLVSVCREVIVGPEEGIDQLMSDHSLTSIVNKAWRGAHLHPGPVHLNIPIEEPLHPSYEEQREVLLGWQPITYKQDLLSSNSVNENFESEFRNFLDLDPYKPGLIVVGPWRGAPENLDGFSEALQEFQSLTGWPVFADPLSGISSNQKGLIEFWELLISVSPSYICGDIQVLRLGPLSSSKKLEVFLRNIRGKQIVITEGEERYLDPLLLAEQYSRGMKCWLNTFREKYDGCSLIPNRDCLQTLENLYLTDRQIKMWLQNNLKADSNINEITLAIYLLDFLPRSLPLMLSSSSPIRDFLTYSGKSALSRRCFGVRGASGIDGNISFAIGISIPLGPLVLVCGDLAFLHDSNSLLLSQPKKYPLIIILIDNKGGGIFKQLNLDDLYVGNIDSLFSMPQIFNACDIAKSHNIPFRKVVSFDDLEKGIAWAMQLYGPVLLHICTNATEDSFLRKEIVNNLKRLLV